MGLDMYLHKKYYVKNWDHTEPKNRHEITIKKGGEKSNIPAEKICYIETEEGYWRKANAIHKWFVDNCQGGVDDCRMAYVGEEKLGELRDLCERVMNDNTLAADLLPTEGGFFFGDTQYDEYYFKDLKYTKELVDRVLATDDNGELYYQSSW